MDSVKAYSHLQQTVHHFAITCTGKNYVIMTHTAYCTLGPAYNEWKDAKETVRSKWLLVVTELVNIAVNDFDAKKFARCSRVLVVSGTQCTFLETNGFLRTGNRRKVHL